MIGLTRSRCKIRQQRLDRFQKKELKQLLHVQQQLKAPEFLSASKGLEGMLIAHGILRSRDAVGILIGGLSEAVWNRRRKMEELLVHKDVDVAVLDHHFQPEQKFEGGIDWWLPRKGNIRTEDYSGTVKNSQEIWFKNGHEIILSFGMNCRSPLNPGLYIPDSEWVLDMRAYEAIAHIDSDQMAGEPDSNILSLLSKRLRKRVKTRLPKFLNEAFRDYILSSYYRTDDLAGAITLNQFDSKTLKAIHEAEFGLAPSE